MQNFLKTSCALAALAAITVSCGQQSAEYAGEDAAYSEAYEAEAADAGGPDVSPTAAPGVAFNYRYAFRLPNSEIASIQEQHAAACEELGIDRCRITGMRYRLVNETDISAMLEFRLDPVIARSFGRDAGELVASVDGMLVDAEISGVDEGANIRRAEVQGANTRDEIARIEAQLRTPGLEEGERIQLNQQLERLRQTQQAVRSRIAASQETLATTPMVFNYGSGEVVPGFDGGTPIRHAFRESGSLFFGTIAFFIIALGAILPWALLLSTIGLAVRWIKPIWRAKFGSTDEIAD